MQCSRIELELLLGLQDDVVLIELCVQRVDLALAEGIVKRVVDGLRRDSEARSRGPINDQSLGHTVQLLIGHHVGKFGQLLEPCNQIAGHAVEFIGIGIFEGVLVLGAAHPIIHGEILHRLHV